MNNGKIIFNDTEITFEYLDTELSKKIQDLLPTTSTYTRWGDEIYFEIPLDHEMEDATSNLEVGDLAYWQPGRCLCIFFGSTPNSPDEKPLPASDVEVFGKITDGWEKLKTITNANITIK